MKNTNTKKYITISIISFFAVILITFFSFTAYRFSSFSKITEAIPLSVEEQNSLQSFLQTNYSEEFSILKPLPYNVSNANVDIGAESAILIDTKTGNIIYEKNADEVIPPASMTKLFAMYVVEEEVRKGNLSYDQIIPLPKESWACNMPPHSSLMFLGKDQQVTLKEILLGLSISSGNDAAYALAYTVCGNMESFVAKMNQIAIDLGLTHTHFEESSGYSELNTTTAREMATFCKYYITNHPQSIADFHSVSEFTYPQEHNLAPGDKLEAQDFSNGFPEHITMPITQKNTNPLLGKLEGCDGLKTGYIDESGYNLSLTAIRNGTRFLSVTMKGPGNNSAEGQKGRIKDGTALMEFAFSSFADFQIPQIKSYLAKVTGASIQSVNLIPAVESDVFCVPYINGETIEENLNNIEVIVSVPEYIHGNFNMGDVFGTIEIKLYDYTLQKIPLITDRKCEKANFIVRVADFLSVKK